MAARFLVVLCASALLVQSIAAYPGCGCGWESAGAIGRAELAAAEIAGAEIAAASGWGYGAPMYATPAYAPASIYSGPAIAASNGGTFKVSLSSPYAPTGITVVSENNIEGALEVVGSLPVLAAVAVDGILPSAGTAGTSYSCGCGDVSIATESLAAAGLGAGLVGAGLARAELAGAAFAGAELAAINAGRAGARLAGAELAGINAGLAGPKFVVPAPGCGCSGIYY